MGQEQLKITVLSENTVGLPKGIVGEWGLSLLVEAGNNIVLFDTGAGGQLVANAAALGVDLQRVQCLVMSHGHYDHSGGLRAFLSLRRALPVYVHPEFFSTHYAALPQPLYIGVPFCREELESLGAEFIYTREPREICPGLWCSGEVPRESKFEKGDPRLCRRVGEGQMETDPFLDDMSLYCQTHQGILIILGCAHAGLVNIVNHAQQVTGEKKIFGIIGGTHLGPVAKEQQKATIEFLTQLDLQFLAANHCTGLPIMAKLAGIFGPRFSFAPAGASFSFDL